MVQQHITAPSRTEIDHYVKLAKAQRNQYIADKATALMESLKTVLRSRFQIAASKQSPSH